MRVVLLYTWPFAHAPLSLSLFLSFSLECVKNCLLSLERAAAASFLFAGKKSFLFLETNGMPRRKARSRAGAATLSNLLCMYTKQLLCRTNEKSLKSRQIMIFIITWIPRQTSESFLFEFDPPFIRDIVAFFIRYAFISMFMLLYFFCEFWSYMLNNKCISRQYLSGRWP